MADGYSEFAYTPKSVIKTDSIGDGQITVQKFSPGLFQQVQKITTHTHNGSDSVQLTGQQSLASYSTKVDRMARQAWTTYTPTVTPSGGGFTSVTGTGRFIQLGNIVTMTVKITITTNGTAAVNVLFTLPVVANTTNLAAGSGRAGGVSGKGLQALIITSTLAAIWNYDGTYPGSNGEILFVSFVYEAA